jgi:dTMP kinase
MIMTQNKVQKAAIRRRMAETGESYVVARRAVLEGAGTAGPVTPEEQYAREAAAEGVSPEEIDARTLAYRLEAAAEQAQRVAERARELAERAEEVAAAAEDRAGEAADAAEEAAEWAAPEELRLLRERASQLREAAGQARGQADRTEEEASAAEERADLAADAAGEAADDEVWEAEPGWAWTQATGGGFQAMARPVPPVPPVPPAPPIPPGPPGAVHHGVVTSHGPWTREVWPVSWAEDEEL